MATVSESYEAGILRRLVSPQNGDFPLEAARGILELRLDAEDQGRLHDLLVRNQAGDLTNEESMELDAFRRVGYFFDLIRAKAMAAVSESGEGP